MTLHFQTVTIIGVGLLGGSLGKALKAKGLATKINGVGHRQSTLDKALESGAIDQAFLDPVKPARRSDLVVLCTPAATVPGFLDILRPVCPPRCILTDVASTKSAICAHVAATWPSPIRFIGSHPMAGSEKFGPEHARPDLYQGCVTVVQAGPSLDPAARATVVELWRALGAEVVDLPPDLHDRLVAQTSHLPHLVAAAVAQVAASGAPLETLHKLVGRGFQDVTRIADSRPEIWRDICLTNRKNILATLDDLAARLDEARNALEHADGDALDRFFRQGKTGRREVLGE
ncbi:MAG TPA: prephenate dehydrogenase/arogenate dehydrogenase family protein [Candidatus Bathyarchaeia archaeon]|nr:prephenate dehydrogenase/arogenate dehydrogenase family protein [Candidatus Bathyarchaeia archaeon]